MEKTSFGQSMTPSQTWSDDDHVCDGVIDCPNDKSDEEKCTCYNQNINESSSAVCKITYPGKRKIFCSNLSYMTKYVINIQIFSIIQVLLIQILKMLIQQTVWKDLSVMMESHCLDISQRFEVWLWD